MNKILMLFPQWVPLDKFHTFEMILSAETAMSSLPWQANVSGNADIENKLKLINTLHISLYEMCQCSRGHWDGGKRANCLKETDAK